jgi:lipopolysaccharide/colanic/teichoic acid biosynthesis glycosyltransferase
LAEVRSQSPHVERAAGRTPPLPLDPDAQGRPPRTAALTVKHIIDRIAAACALVVTAPLYVVVAVALFYGSDGRILRREQRTGEGGRTITVRSFAVTDRLTRGSRFWRIVVGSGLTALPQLWSVLRGEMSIIGPRPRETGFTPPPMRPGLTGLAQLEQLERWLSITEQLELDAEYAQKWTLRLDARIVWRTMWCVLR